MRDWIHSDEAKEVIISLQEGETKICNFVDGFWILKREVVFVKGKSESLISRRYVEVPLDNNIKHEI